MADMLGDALREVCGPLHDLTTRLKGKNGDEWLTALKRFLRKENPWPSPPVELATFNTFKVWKTLKYQDSELDLVLVSPRELGYPFSAPRKAIYSRAMELGLTLAPSEIAELLLTESLNLGSEDVLVIASDPVHHPDYAYTWTWTLSWIRDDGNGPKMNESRGGPCSTWNCDWKFVFVLARR